MKRRVLRAPFKRTVTIQSEVDRLYDDGQRYASDEYPQNIPLDARGDADGFTIEAELPGFTPEEIEISILENDVTISAQKATEIHDESEDYIYNERRSGKIVRTIRLPADLDPDRAEATVENGVLTLRIPKAESAKPKTIPIKKSKLDK